MDEVVISVDTSLFEQTLMMALISKSSDFNLIFNLTANKGLTRTTIFYFQTWRWSHGKIIHSCNVRLRDYNIPDTGNVWKLFIFRIKNATLRKDISRGAGSEVWNRVSMIAPVKKFGWVRLSTNFPWKQIWWRMQTWKDDEFLLGFKFSRIQISRKGLWTFLMDL